MRNPPCESEPNEDGTCKKCETNEVSNGCVYITLNAGQTTMWSDGRPVEMKVFSQSASPQLFTPAMLRVVMGYAFQNLGPNHTKKGAPAEVVFADAAGAALRFRFAENSSLGIPDPGQHLERPERLIMVDAEGWATLKDPAYYDLYVGDGSRWRFLATNQTQSLGELIDFTDSRGRRITLDDFGIEIIRDSHGQIAQLLTANRLSDITILPENDLVTGYTVSIYPIISPPAFDDSIGRFVIPSGIIPERVLTVQNGTKQVTNAEGETLTLRDDHLLYANLKKGGAFDQRYTFVYKNGDWTLTKPDQTVTQKEFYTGDNDDAEMINKTFDGAGNLLAQKVSFFETFSWGYSMTNQVEGADGVTRSSSWRYVTIGSAKGKVARMDRSSGYWETYIYDAEGKRIRTESPVSGMPDHPSATKVVTVGYAPVDPNDPVLVNDLRPRSIVETIAGIETKRTYYAYPTNSLGARLEIRERAAEQYAVYGATNSLRSITAYHPPSADPLLAGRLDYRQSEDGTVQKYDYLFGDYNAERGTFTPNPEGNYWCERITNLHGWNSMQPVSMKTTRTLSVYTPSGNRVFEAEQLFDENDEWVELNHIRYTFNPAGNEIRTETNNGFITETEWSTSCCGESAYTDEQGVRTIYQYDINGHLIIQTVLDPNPIETHYAYDTFGRVVTTFSTNRIDKLGTPPLHTEYDILGRIISASDFFGNWTTNTYTELTRTTLHPTGLSQTSISGVDGRPLRAEENLLHPTDITYGVNSDGTQWTLQAFGARWTKTTTDFLGRPLFTKKPGFANTTLINKYFYSKEKLILIQQLDAENEEIVFLSVRYTYEPDGELLYVTNELDGLSMCREDSYQYIDGLLWQTNVDMQYAEDEVRTNSVTRTLIQYSTPATFIQDFIDPHGRITRTVRDQDRTARKETTTIYYSDALRAQVSIAISGYTVTNVLPSRAISTIRYDGLNRFSNQTNERGNTTSVYYTPNGLIDFTSDATGHKTLYSYDKFGRNCRITDSMTNTLETAYDQRNRVVRKGGSVYPVEYDYDLYGQQVALRTWQSAEGRPDTTRWVFDEPTGELVKKVYADGQGPTYTYTPNGLLATRTWARGIVTSYSYTPDGKLSVITYSDGTPSVSHTYTKWGEDETVRDALGTTTYTYENSGHLKTEFITGLYTKELTHHVDSHGRSTGYSIDGNRKTTLEYDIHTGELYSMETPLRSFVWESPLEGSIKEKLRYPNRAQALVLYENNSDRIASVQNTANGEIVSHYTYQNDFIGRRIAISINAAFAPQWNDNITYTYNNRSELMSALAQNNTEYDYAYQFDEIGNRTSITENGFQTVYMANNLNQYTAINDFMPEFDADGNQTLIQTLTGVWQVQYNAENRPIIWLQGDKRIEMGYDYLGRRVSLKSYMGNELNRYSTFFYSNHFCLQELSAGATNVVCKEFIWNPKNETPLQFTIPDEDEIYFYMFDANKNVTDIIKGEFSPKIAAHYEYSPFGAISRYSYSAEDENLLKTNPYRFSSEYYDDELGLSSYMYRFYNPLSGRWIQRDPIAEQGGENLYGFIFNNAINYTDSLGLKKNESTHVLDTTPCTWGGLIKTSSNSILGNGVIGLAGVDPQVVSSYLGKGIACERCKLPGIKYKPQKIKCSVKIYVREGFDPDGHPGAAGLSIWEHEKKHVEYYLEYIKSVMSIKENFGSECVPKECDTYRTDYVRIKINQLGAQKFVKDANLHAKDYPKSDQKRWKKMRENYKKAVEKANLELEPVLKNFQECKAAAVLNGWRD